MNRLWKATLSIGLFAAVSMGDSIRFGRSSWPAVTLFCLAGLLACAAACIDAAAESAKHEAELDVTEQIEAAKHIAIGEAVCALGPRLEAIDVKIEHLQKKDALNALG